MSTMTPIDFLILDEHTAALDPKTAELIMELTDKIVREKHLTTIMVTHNLRYAVEYGKPSSDDASGRDCDGFKGRRKKHILRWSRSWINLMRSVLNVVTRSFIKK